MLATLTDVPGLIDRDELLAALDRASKRKVTVISAPAGSGKTSLLRQWCDHRQRERRIAFMTVRPGQHDAQLFWHTVLGAVRAANGAARTEPVAAPEFDGTAMVRRVLAEIEATGDPFVLIVDDLHELSSAEATDQLTSLLSDLPAQAHAILATRRDPHLGLHRLRLAGELAEIRVEQLRFTEAETGRLLAAAHIALPAHATMTLHQRTEGWAAGLRLAVLSLARHPDPERFVAEFSGTDRTVAEYLMAEMLDQQPNEVRRLLLRTSLLDRVNGELADLVTGASGSERILLDLEDANAFVVSLDPGRTWFRYHHLVAGFLRLELRRTQAGALPALHRIAARWFAEDGEPADAVRHLQAAGDWGDAARLLSDRALSLTLDGQAGTVAELLRAFPAGTAGNASDLAVVHAIADLDHMRLDDAAAHLATARANAAASPLAITAVDLLLARLRGHFDDVFEQVSALPPPTAGDGDLRAIALLNLGVTEAWSLRLADSERHLLEGVALARDLDRPYLEVACLAHLGFAATTHSLAQGRQRCDDAVALAAQHGWDTAPVIAPALATLAGTLIWTGELVPGEQWLDRARRATRVGGEPGIRLLVHLVAAELAAARGDQSTALDELVAAGRVQALMAGEHALTTRVIGWTIATRARCGMVDQARAELAAVDEPRLATAELRTAAAVLRLVERDPAGARRELRTVHAGTAPAAWHLSRVEALLVDALACRDLGDQRAVRASVEEALDLAERDRLILPFATTGAWQLLETLPPHETSHGALVADILDAGRRSAATAAAAEDLTPSELRVLGYLPTNLTRTEIAGQLSISLNTVSTHIRRIYAKLGATDRSTAVERGRDLRLLAPGAADAATPRTHAGWARPYWSN